MKTILVYSSGSKGILDDDYTLYDNGEILHEYDRHTYPGGYNLKSTLKASDLSQSLKERLYKDAPENNKILVRKLLQLDKES